MPRYLAPGVYVEEAGYRSKSIEGLGIHTTAFIGPTLTGPELADGEPPPLLTSFNQFERHYGDLDDLPPAKAGGPPRTNHMAYAARAFFTEGGQRLHIARLPAADLSVAAHEQALLTLEALPDVGLLAAPGSTEPQEGQAPDHAQAVARALIRYAERPGAWCFAVLDAPPRSSVQAMLAYADSLDSAHAALYHPWIVAAANAPGQTLLLPPSGFLCGVYARTDSSRGAHHAPTNEVLHGVVRFETQVRQADAEVLNPRRVNCLRYFDGRGHRVWGARTLSSDPEWKYVHVRRYFHHLQRSLARGTRWAATEPNAEPLWAALREAIGDFLYSEWRHGALFGATPQQAFFVRCDLSTMTQSDIAEGRLICTVGVAIVRPSEFTIFRLELRVAGAPA